VEECNFSPSAAIIIEHSASSSSDLTLAFLCAKASLANELETEISYALFRIETEVVLQTKRKWRGEKCLKVDSRSLDGLLDLTGNRVPCQ